MDPHYIHEFILALLREISRKRVVAVIAFCITCLATTSTGLVWPLKYQTNATLYVDERNIIEPLLEGQATVQAVDQALEAKEKIYTRQILEKVARDAQLIADDSDSKAVAATLAMLGEEGTGGGIQITNNGPNYIGVSFQHPEPEVSFNVVTALINAFIRNIAESKRQESKEAHNFIQTQVNIYKDQLKVAEEKLEAFHANNRDGTEVAASNKISQLRSDIEELQLQIDEVTSRRNTIRKQLKDESEYLQVRTQSDVYRQRIQGAQDRLKNMLIHLTETHPDVVSLKLQIEDHRRAIIDIEQRESMPGNNRNSSNNSNLALNPLYEDLRSNLSETEIELNAATHKVKTLKKILEQEYSRAERIASRRADLAELNRDYTVTKNLYEDMLNRKEKARLSMTLDIEGQGTSYKVHEPPTFPLSPSGLNPTHFMLMAPLIGLLAPLGLIGAFIFLDPRIRLPSDLNLIDGCEVLAITSPVLNTETSYSLKQDNILCVVTLFVGLSIYGWIASKYVLGVI